jgi:hypothetical protein
VYELLKAVNEQTLKRMEDKIDGVRQMVDMGRRELIHDWLYPIKQKTDKLP